MENIKFNDLTITKVEIFNLNVHLKKPFIISLGVIKDAPNTAIKIHTNQKGLYGVGEASPTSFITGDTQESNFEFAKMLAELIKGKNPLEVEDRILEINRDLKFNPTIKSAFDMALYDILGKYTNMPLYALWGGKNNRTITTDMTVGIHSPDEMAKEALAFKNAGFPAIKVKLGEGKEIDVARIQAIRKAIGMEIPVRIDANQGWDTVTAISTLKALEKYNIEHCEEPIPRWNNSDLALVRSKSPISIMADESLFDYMDAFRLASMKACDYFNIKLAKSGGLNSALKIISIAESAGIKSQVGCMSETRVGLTALAHLVVARKNIVHFDMDSALMHEADPVIGGITYHENGVVKVPDTPGIGADFDPVYLEKTGKVTIG
ncbi:MAG: dipeptide epimerase [Deltaproteobacteria bacterium]|jgi:L-Ala-D/L-Glu epimerase|nr:dipeptide epimerase [Deltaproteobacteria bacterium]